MSGRKAEREEEEEEKKRQNIQDYLKWQWNQATIKEEDIILELNNKNTK